MSYIGHPIIVLLLSPKTFVKFIINVYHMKSFIMKKVVCIGDDLEFNQLVTNYFSANHIRVVSLNGHETVTQIQSLGSDILLIDLTPPNQTNNFLLVKQIREMTDIPILFTTSRKHKETMFKAIGFHHADFIHKPVDLDEMAARMNKLITLTAKYSSMLKFKLGQAYFLLCEQSIEYNGQRIHLSCLETKILHRLYQYRNEYIDRNSLICKIWETPDYKLQQGTFRNVLWRIRKKLHCLEGVTIDTHICNNIKLIVPE